ncbi:MAG: mevalonate kinase, partial [bacterium]|nr:mevalonate kinase [bacterium]
LTNDLEKPHPKEIKFVLTAVLNFFEKYKLKSGLEIKTKSEFSAKVGLGSSSAVAVSTIKGLAELSGIEITDKELFDLSYKTVLDIQDVGSGFDVAAAIYGGTLYFVTGGKIIEPLKTENMPLLVGYTGIKADTATLVKIVGRKLKKEPKKYNEIFNQSQEIVNLAKTEMKKSNWQKVGELMNLNQDLLRKLGVSSKELENLIKAALDSGAYGAKLSGAGGGDCMVAMTPMARQDDVKTAIGKAGGTIVEVKVQAEGVKIE